MKIDFVGFSEAILGGWIEGYSFDGFDIQELAVQYGLLRSQEMQEPCGEICACRDFQSGFPTECFRKTFTNRVQLEQNEKRNEL